MIRNRIAHARRFISGDGLGSYLARSLAGSGAVQLIAMVFTFLVGVQLARGLGVEGFGQYGIAMAIISIVTIPAAMGLPKLVTREVAAADARRDPAALLGVIRWADRASLFMSLWIIPLIGVAAAIAYARGSTTVAAAVLLGMPMVLLLPLADLRGGALRALHEVVTSQLIIVLLRPLVLSIALLMLTLVGLSLTAPIAVLLSTIIAGLIFLSAWKMLRRRLPAGVAPRLDAHREWLSSTIPLGMSSALQTVQGQLATLALGLLATASEVGILRVATSTAVIVGVPATIMASVAAPMYSRLHAEGDYRRLQKLVTLTARIQFAGVVVLALPLFLATEPLLKLAFGATYVSAAPTLRVLAVGMLITTVSGPNGAVLNMTGRERTVVRALSAALLVNGLLILILAPRWGSVGTAVGIVGSQFCWNAILWIKARSLLGLDTSVLGRSFGAGRASTGEGQ